MKRLAMIVAVMLGAGACGGDGGVPSTLGGLCSDTGSAYCDRLEECDSAPEGCFDIFYGACCDDDGNCDQELSSEGAPSDDEYNDCIDAFGDLTCEQAEAGEVPAECNF